MCFGASIVALLHCHISSLHTRICQKLQAQHIIASDKKMLHHNLIEDDVPSEEIRNTFTISHRNHGGKVI
jgi:hypothetical protein